MDRAGELASSDKSCGIVVVADYQRAGRGTRGRRWEAALGTCLMFTAVLHPTVLPAELPDLPAHIGRLIARQLTCRLHIQIELEHPNDLVIEGRKVCGILCQSRVKAGRVDHVLCGIGLNTCMTRDQLPTAEAISLRECGIEVPRHEELLEWMLDALTPLR